MGLFLIKKGKGKVVRLDTEGGSIEKTALYWQFNAI